MNSIKAPQSASKKFLLFSLFLVLCLPLITWQIVNENFDIRNLAFEKVQVSEENPCVISFPNVNPYTLPAGETVRMQVEGIAKGSGITSIVIKDKSGKELFNKSYTSSEQEIAETFEFTPTETRAYEIIGTLSEGTYNTACVISSPYDIKGVRAVASNSAPEFLTSPIDSNPSQDIDTGISYEYTLSATDPEGDFINYVFSFTPNNEWLKHTVIEDGSDGNLKIQFKGSTSEPASYLANVFIHDGYSKNLRSQSWIISVNPEENDIPKVTILSPWEAITLNQGEPLEIKWGATDRNLITHYELYMSQSLQDEESWYAIDKDIAYDKEQYTVDTNELSAGTYKAIVTAEDNQDPPLIGRGISPQIVIEGEEFDMPDDQVEIPEPQIINVSPTNEDDITNRLVTIRASLLSSKGAEIKEDSIQMFVDGREVSSLAKFNKISESEYTIIYQTEEEYESGLHKVELSFTDTRDLEAEKSWVFNIATQGDDPDKFYILGYGISKIIVYVVGGGILLLILSLVVPLILVKVWKEDENTLEEDDTLMPPQPNNTVEKIVNSNTDENTNFSTIQAPLVETPTPEQYSKPPLREPQATEPVSSPPPTVQENSSGDTTAPTTTVNNAEIPEPDEELLELYEKINDEVDNENPEE